MLYCISALMIPPLARFTLVSVVGSHDSTIAARLITCARLIVTLLVPFMAVVALNQQCFAFWLRLWTPCQDDSQFDINIYKKLSFMTTVGPITVYKIFEATSHNDICSPTYNTGECPRAVIDTLGSLIYEKLQFTAFVGPMRMLLLNTKAWRRGQEWFVRTVFRAGSYEMTTDMDNNEVQL